MLRGYGEKRDFSKTPEPPPRPSHGGSKLLFVVQKHAARRLHYDLRLEAGGALKSWSVPGGPSLSPAVKRLAVLVEDHPLDYRSFEGNIPGGQYGAGQVIVWDEGTYTPEDSDRRPVADRMAGEELMRSGLEQGKISFTLRGHKLKGSWTLVKMRSSENNWLLIKHKDEFAASNHDVLAEEKSVISGLSITDLKAGHLPPADPPFNLDPASVEGAQRSSFPSSVKPMLAYLATSPPSGAGWLFEPKLDGFRTIALIREGKIKLLSRHSMDVTENYAGLAAELSRQTSKSLVLDGEIIALDENGNPCFQCLQQYSKTSKSPAGPKTPLLYYVFDILYLDGYELYSVPLLKRRELLSHALEESEHVRRTVYFDKDGPAVYEAAKKQGLEGIMAKRSDSIYVPGLRSHDWQKVKAMLSDDFVIGGYTHGFGNRAHSFGALLLGYYDENGALIYAGHVGSGFDDPVLAELKARLDAIVTDKCPFDMPPPLNAPASWVRPELVAEVKFSQWTNDGRLRTPVFLRLREDKSPDEVHRVEILNAETQPTEAGSEMPSGDIERILDQLQNKAGHVTIESEGHRLALTNLDKILWPELGGRPAITKRDLLAYLANISRYILPHLEDRPLTLKRYPEGIHGQFFYQRHLDEHRPPFVEAVSLTVEQEGAREFLMCNNVITLMWLGQMGSIEFHTWFSRLSLSPEGIVGDLDNKPPADITNYPDFIIFDLDPYIYSGKEAAGEEPELNRVGFLEVGQVALWLKEILDSLSLSSFVKTSGRTGLHIYVPINRRLDYRAVRAAAETIARFVLQQHPREVSIEWAVEKRSGKVFIDYNQNVRGKTLGAIYAPRVAPEATVSTPLSWDEIGKVYPTDFTILSVPGRLNEIGDLWANILEAKRDLKSLLKI